MYRTRTTKSDRLLDVIDAVYEAALDVVQWDALAPRIAAAFDSTSTTLQLQGQCTQILSMTDNVAGGIGDYREYFWRRDIWVARAVERLDLAQVGTSEDMVSDTEFAESEFYRDWCRHLGVFYVVGAVFGAGAGNLGVLGVHRAKEAGPYDESHRLAVQRFLPHLQRALRLRSCLGQAALQRGVTEAALGRAQLAVFLVCADARLVYANAEAEALLARGTVLRSSQGRLNAADPRAAERLSALIQDACGTDPDQSPEGVMALKGWGCQPLGVLVAPLRHSVRGYPSGLAIVLVRDPHRCSSALQALQSLFALTPTEARIAQALVRGDTPEVIAREHHAKVATVRKQINGILAKTGTRRQSECVALILRSAAMLAQH